MAQFYQPQPRKVKPQRHENIPVTGLDHQGRGVIRVAQKTYFVAQTLPGDVIDVSLEKPPHAHLVKLKQRAPQRIQPRCQHYQDCGGCDMQHLDIAAQQEHKQSVVADLLRKFAQTAPQQWHPPVTGSPWAYRQRTRLATKWQPRSRTLKIGFRARASSQLVEISECLVLTPSLLAVIRPLQVCLQDCDLAASLGHIELIQSEASHILLRLTQALSTQDLQRLQDFAGQHNGLQIWLQHAGQGVPTRLPSSIAAPLQAAETSPAVPTYQSDQRALAFTPGDFIQANQGLNSAMVAQAMAWLAPQPGEQILELFAGTGNFTLAMAARGAQVTAVEGDARMTQQLLANAAQYQLQNIKALTANLNAPWSDAALQQTGFDKVLLDPARAGAQQALAQLLKQPQLPQRILYVSCAPDTFARDAADLRAAGYQLRHCGLVDMFPQTHHIETMGLFERAE